MKSDKNQFTPERPLSAEQSRIISSMKMEIDRKDIKAVSFRIQDVLLELPFSSEGDIFTLLEETFSGLYTGTKTFSELRYEAESIVSGSDKKLLKKGKPLPEKPVLERIYDVLEKKSKISSSSREKLIKREYELEKYFFFARSSGQALYNHALAQGKKIILILDENRNLSAENAEKLLSLCKFRGWDSIVMPGIDCPADRVFEYIMEKTKLSARNLLHIGSDVVRDVEQAVRNGIRALLLSPPNTLMMKSGRLGRWLRKTLIYEYDTKKYLALRCAEALYSCYAFDCPQNKNGHSDFCNDDYMTGFIILGTLALCGNYTTNDKLKSSVLDAMTENKKMLAGRRDFLAMYDLHFGSHLCSFGCEGMELPFEFFFRHGALCDRMILQKSLGAVNMTDWSQAVTEPELIPGRGDEHTGLYKLADKMFPPGTQVRNYTEAILSKMKKRKI